MSKRDGHTEESDAERAELAAFLTAAQSARTDDDWKRIIAPLSDVTFARLVRMNVISERDRA